MSDPGVAAALADLRLTGTWRRDAGDVGTGWLGDVAAGMLAAGADYVDHLPDPPSGDTAGYCGNPGCSGACAPAAPAERSRPVGTCRRCGGRLIESEVIRAVRRGALPVCGECWRAGAA